MNPTRHLIRQIESRQIQPSEVKEAILDGIWRQHRDRNKVICHDPETFVTAIIDKFTKTIITAWKGVNDGLIARRFAISERERNSVLQHADWSF